MSFQERDQYLHEDFGRVTIVLPQTKAVIITRKRHKFRLGRRVFYLEEGPVIRKVVMEIFKRGVIKRIKEGNPFSATLPMLRREKRNRGNRGLKPSFEWKRLSHWEARIEKFKIGSRHIRVKRYCYAPVP